MKRWNLFVIFIFLPFVAFSQVTIGFTNFRPVAYMEDGQLTGFYVELLREILDSKNIDYEFVLNDNFPQIYQQILNKEVDIFASLIRTPQREDLIYWPDSAIVTNYSVLFVNEKVGFEAIENLNGEFIGFVINEASGLEFERLMQSFNVEYNSVYFETFDDMISSLEAQQIYGFVASSLLSIPESVQDIAQSTFIFSPFSSYVTSAVDASPEVKSVVDQISSEISRLKNNSDSIYWQLFEKYYDSSVIVSIPLWLYFAVGSLALTVLASTLIINFLTRRLRNYNTTLEHAVEEASKNLIDAEKRNTIAQLVTGVAHEINTPIGVVLTSSTFLESAINSLKTKFEEKALKVSDFESFFKNTQTSFEIINFNLNRATELIRTFKNLSSDQFTNEKRLVNISSYIDKIILSIKPEFKGFNIEIKENIDDVEVEIYPDVIAIAVINIMLNALNHGFDRDDTGVIVVEGHLAKNEFILMIENNGKKIPDENIERIFNPFFSTRRTSGNTGIGLNIVYNTVKDKLGGTIDVESTDEFTRFVIRFPV